MARLNRDVAPATFIQRKTRLISHLFIAALILNNPSAAQTAKITVKGKVLDPDKNPIPGASVVAIKRSQAPQTATATDDLGFFSFSLSPGSYTIQISEAGFQTESRSVVVGTTDLELDPLTLAVAPLQTSVDVAGNAGYLTPVTSSATRTLTPLIDTPQTVNVVTQQQVRDQIMLGIGDVVRYIPGVSAHQGENNRDEVIIRGVDSSADFYLNGMRDDVQYYRDLYNLDRVEVLKGPNELTSGRGGGGGVVNRVTKEANQAPFGELVVDAGSFYNKRVAIDFDRPLTSKLAFRLNGVYENSDSFRKQVGLERYAVNPTITYNPTQTTKVTVGFENLRDTRTADRGITSFQGIPVNVPIETFYGNPKDSHTRALVNLGSVLVEHQTGKLTIRNRSLIGNYDRGYQNYVPGAVTADQKLVNLTAYNNATVRTNILNQTDFIYTANTGSVRHTLLAGIDLERQLTDNLRNTGYFNGTSTTLQVPFSDPTVTSTATFIHAPTDAFNHLRTNIGAGFVQDQVSLNRYIQLIGGVRFDHFDLQFHDNNLGNNRRRIDNLVSPKAGIIFKPAETVSIYTSYNVSHLPSSGDQFGSLTNITQQVKPEKFTNYEAGVKWNAREGLALTAAVYRLDRTNTRATDPNNPTAIIQTGSQRSNGIETGVTGSITRKWEVSGGYAYQDNFVTSATTVARAGAQVAQSPHHMFSLWNNYQVLPPLGVGLGLLNRSYMYAGIDDTVRIPSYFRADAAVFYSVSQRIRLQTNVENLFNRKYFVNADSNTNISPGFPRTIRVALVYHF